MVGVSTLPLIRVVVLPGVTSQVLVDTGSVSHIISTAALGSGPASTPGPPPPASTFGGVFLLSPHAAANRANVRTTKLRRIGRTLSRGLRNSRGLIVRQGALPQ